MLFQPLFKILQPDIHQGEIQKSFTESKSVFMGIPAIAVFFMWKIFFIPADQVKACCKNVERIITIRFKKCFVAVNIKTGYFLRDDRFLKKERVSFDEKFICS